MSDEHIHWQLNDESNSVAIIAKHVSGNMVSGWTDFLTTDDEKRHAAALTSSKMTLRQKQK